MGEKLTFNDFDAEAENLRAQGLGHDVDRVESFIGEDEGLIELGLKHLTLLRMRGSLPPKLPIDLRRNEFYDEW